MAPAARFRNAALLYNPAAGRGRRRRERELDRAVDLLGACGIRVARIPTTGPGSATALARAEVAAGRDLLIACGGDGTINEVVNGMAGSAVPLAILPAGTGNVLATHLALPWDIWRAAEYIPRGVVRRVSLGKAGTRFFACLAGAGADGHLFYRLNQLPAGDLKYARYFWEGYRQLWLYDFPWFEVQVNDEVIRATQLIVSRVKHYAFPLAPAADLFRDDFEVCVIGTRSRFRYFLYSFAVFVDKLDSFPEVRRFPAHVVRAVARAGRVRVETDAESAGELPMEFTVVPEALALVVPEKRIPGWTRSRTA
jgi:diacylglycerol kinase family enzyme